MRLEILADNPDRRAAERTDTAALERELRRGRAPQSHIDEALDKVRRRRELPERRLYIFDLNPAHGHAVERRQEREETGRLLLDARNEGFEKVPGREVWLPRKSVIDYYAFSSAPGVTFDSPIITRVIEIESVGTDPLPDERFVLNYTTPGSIVTDYTLGGPALTYVVPAGTEHLDESLAVLATALAPPRWPAGGASAADAAGPAVVAGEAPQVLPDDGGRSPVPLAQAPFARPASPAWYARPAVLFNALAAAFVASLAVWRYAQWRRHARP